MKLLFVFVTSLFSVLVYAQNNENSTTPNYNDSLITVNGKVMDTTAQIGFYNMMVVNRTEGRGIFGAYDGTFTIQIKKTDKVAISVTGYKTIYLNFSESIYQKEYDITLYLELISFVGEVVEVKPYKTLQELKEERAAVAKREIPKLTGVNVLQSPITALYMQFSKREKTKRMLAELEFQDQKREIVREILRVYVHNDILDLEDDEFDSFITFLNLNDNFLRTATDYELIVYIKSKFEHYQKINSEGY